MNMISQIAIDALCEDAARAEPEAGTSPERVFAPAGARESELAELAALEFAREWSGTPARS